MHWDHEPWRAGGAGFQACGFGQVSSRPFVVQRTRRTSRLESLPYKPVHEKIRGRHRRSASSSSQKTKTSGSVAEHKTGFGPFARLKQSKNVRRRTPAGKLSSVKSAARSLRGHETVVVVTERAPSRGVLSRLLKRMGYRVVEAANGMEAQRLAAGESRIDLLLTEFSALGTSGVELVRWFLANRPEIKVLVAADWLWEVESCLGDLPQVGILAKQFTPTELARMVRAILHPSRLNRL